MSTRYAAINTLNSRLCDRISEDFSVDIFNHDDINMCTLRKGWGLLVWFVFCGRLMFNQLLSIQCQPPGLTPMEKRQP